MYILQKRLRAWIGNNERWCFVASNKKRPSRFSKKTRNMCKVTKYWISLLWSIPLKLPDIVRWGTGVTCSPWKATTYAGTTPTPASKTRTSRCFSKLRHKRKMQPHTFLSVQQVGVFLFTSFISYTVFFCRNGDKPNWQQWLVFTQ